MSSLLLLRHGQASFGAADYDRLSPLGEQQAAATGAHWLAHGARFDAVWVGPKRRHADTARRALDVLGSRGGPGVSAENHVPVTDAALDEFAEGGDVVGAAELHFGVTLHGDAALPRRQQLEHYDRLIEAWARGDALIPGRPDVATFRATVAGWLQRVVNGTGRDQRLLAVTSAGTIGVVMCELLGAPNAELPRFTRVLRNASLTELVFSRGRCSLLSFNSVGHLPPALQSAI